MGLFKSEISKRKPHDLPNEITCIEDALNIGRAIFYSLLTKKKDPFFEHSLLNPENLFLDIWYRGEDQNYKGTSLVPKVFRNDRGEYDETKIFNFLPPYSQELSDMENDLDKLAYMQNYNIPTRLLDWSDNILVGLYFAVEDAHVLPANKHEKDHNKKLKPGKLFVLNSRLLNYYTSLKKGHKNIPGKGDLATEARCTMVNSDKTNEWYDRIIAKIGRFDWKRDDLNPIPIEHLTDINLKAKKSEQNTEQQKREKEEEKDLSKVFSPPVAVQPDKTHNARVAKQGTYFTLFGGKNPIETTNLPKPFKFQDVQEKLKENGLNGKFYMAFTVPSDRKAEIKQELLNLQIHKGKVYPELEKQDELVDLIGLNKKGK